MEPLERHRKRQEEKRLVAGEAWDEKGLVFTNPRGGVLDANNLRRRAFPRVLKRAGFAVMRFRDLRHTIGTLLLEDNPATVISEFLGHASIAVTLGS